MKMENLSGLDVETMNESLEAILENPERDASVFRTVNQWENGTIWEIEEKEISSKPYARCIAASKAVRWDIDKDVIRGRSRGQPRHSSSVFL